MNATTLILVSTLTLGQAAPLPELYQDLRMSQPLVPGLKISGPFISKYTFPENEGLRVLLPPKREKPGPIAIESDFALSGDFEITGTYEILEADRPAKPMGIAGVSIYIVQAGEGDRFARIGRFNTGNMGHAYSLQHTDRSKAKSTDLRNFPTTEKTGQLRLVRTGRFLSYQVKDVSTGNEYKELYVRDFGDDKLSLIKFAVNTGPDFWMVEARLIDLRVKGEGAPPTPAWAVPGGDDPPPARPRNWLAAAAVLGVSLVIIIGLTTTIGVIVMRRRSGPKTEKSAHKRKS